MARLNYRKLSFCCFIVAAYSLPPNTLGCAIKNFSTLCPDGWFETGDGKSCTAPPSYGGPCATYGIFKADRKRKQEIEKICKVAWPCLEECEKDYDIQCPKNWHESTKGICVATSSYAGHCDRVYNFASFSVDQKKALERRCDVSWRCLPKCNRDYNASCPEGWGLIGEPADEICLALDTYTGPCVRRMSFSGLSKEMKISMEKKCDFQFPCSGTCSRDFAVQCPKKWFYLSEKKQCQAPDDYRGACQGKHDIADTTELEKRRFSLKCEVDWPCVEGELEEAPKTPKASRSSIRGRSGVLAPEEGPVDPETGSLYEYEKETS